MKLLIVVTIMIIVVVIVLLVNNVQLDLKEYKDYVDFGAI
jgi:hypothetical protein